MARNKKPFPLVPVALGLGALALLYVVTRPKAPPAIPDGGFRPPPAPPPAIPGGGRGGGGAFVPSERDRLADEGRALLNAAQNPATVTKAQLRAKAAELRRVQEPELAQMLENTANDLPV